MSPARGAPWGAYRELQVDDAVFSNIVENVVDRMGSSFCAATMPCINNSNETCVLEQIRSTGQSYFNYGPSTQVNLDGGLIATGNEVLFHTSVELDLMTQACAHDPSCVPANCTNYPSCLPPGAHSTHQVPVSFKLKTKGAEVCLELHEILYGAYSPSLLTNVGVPSEFCFGGELGAVDALIAPLQSGASAITWDANQGLVAIRSDFLPPAGTNSAIDAQRLQAFNAFLSGTATPGVPGQDWNMVISGGALAKSMEHNLVNTIASQSKLKPKSGGSTGSSYFLGAAVGSADAEAYTGSFCDWVDISPLWVSSQPSLASGGQQVDIHVEIGWDVNDWDVAKCILSNPLGAILAPISIPIGLAVANSQGLPNNIPSFGQLTCVDGNASSGKEAVDCTASVPAISTSVGGGTVNFDINGDVHSLFGWNLFGSVQTQFAPVATSNWNLSAGISYGVQGGCNSLSLGYGGSATLSGPVQVCDMQKVENPHGVYDIGPFEVAPGNVKTAELTFPTIISTLCPNGNGSYSKCPPGQSELDAFWNNPEPFVLRFTTKRGIRTFAIPAPAQASPQSELQAQILLQAAKIDCMSLQTGFLGIPGMFDPRWMIDPPPIENLIRVSQFRGGRTQILGAVQLTNIEVGFLEPPVALDGSLSLDAVSVIVEATAVVDAGRSYEVPVSFQVEMGFEAQAWEDGVLELTQVTDALADVDLASALPREFAGASYTANLPAGTVQVSAAF